MQQGKKRMIFFKWTVYSLLLVFLYILQVTPGVLNIGEAKPLLLIPFAVIISMFEGEFSGAIIGIFSGLLWDLNARRLFGFNAVILMAICTIIGLVAIYFIRTNVWSALLMTLGAVVLHGLLDFYFLFALWSYDKVNLILWNYYLPNAIYTLLLTPVLYGCIKKIAFWFSLRINRS